MMDPLTQKGVFEWKHDLDPLKQITRHPVGTAQIDFLLAAIREVKNSVTVPVSAYNISGEYAMIKAAAKMGWLDQDKAILETLTAIKRSGADLIATYFAKDAVRLIG